MSYSEISEHVEVNRVFRVSLARESLGDFGECLNRLMGDLQSIQAQRVVELAQFAAFVYDWIFSWWFSPTRFLFALYLAAAWLGVKR
jgi:hypothetical protein